MPAITPSATELELLRRCFAAGKPKDGDVWEDQGQDEPLPICAEAAEVAGSLLAMVEPGQSIVVGAAIWEAFALCCEVGAELLDASRHDGLSDAQYDAVIRLVNAPLETPCSVTPAGATHAPTYQPSPSADSGCSPYTST